MNQRFPTWWQALLLTAAGIVVFLASLASTLSGMGGGGQHLPENLLAAGVLIGAAMAIAGVVLAIIVIIPAVARAFSSKPQPAKTGLGSTRATPAIAQVPPTRRPIDTEQSILWRLRIVIIISMILSASNFWSTFFVLNHRVSGSRYLEYSLLSYLLSEVPYILTLVRTAHRADRIGVSIPLAASIFYLGLWLWSVHGYLRFYSVVARWALTTPVLDILVLTFAWQASRIYAPDEKEKELVGAVVFAVGVYVIGLHFGLIHARAMFLR